MENEIIKIKINAEGKQTVNARELHEFLEVETRFNDWITRRVDEYDFINNIDYLRMSKSNYTGIGKAPVEYHISIDMAKELSMVERNEKGKQARKYFIECEKIARRLIKLENKPTEMSRLEILQMAIQSETERLKAIEERDEAIKTKAMISDKKTATAMATASAATRKVESLKNQLGEGKTWKTVTAIPWLKNYFPEISKSLLISLGKKLTLLSKNMKYEIKKVEGQVMTVNAYHVDVVNAFEKLLNEDPRILFDYRFVALLKVV